MGRVNHIDQWQFARTLLHACATSLNHRSMADPFFFGYGSLVNTRTHIYDEPTPARLRGWRRVWVRGDGYAHTLLSVEPCAQTEILGLMCRVPGDDWSALDLRESGYDRHSVEHHSLHHTRDGPHDTHVYRVPPGGSADEPILLSYLDVVVQGFLEVFGEDGVQSFFQTTHGWDTPILNDRRDPRYPRHQSLEHHERDLVDANLAMLGSRVLD